MKRNNTAIFLSVGIIPLILTILACSFIIQNNSSHTEEENVLPEYATEEKNILPEYKAEWYNEIKSIMIDESSNIAEQKIVHEYIVANSISFSGINLVHIKTFDNQTGQMTRKFYNSEFASEGEMIYNKRISLSKEQTETIVSLFEDNNFWNIPPEHPEEELGLDGWTVFIEGRRIDKYNIASMWCPSKEYEIRKIHDGIFSYADIWGLTKE